MAQCKRDLTPLLMHWGYVFLALTHQYDTYIYMYNYVFIPFAKPLVKVNRVSSISWHQWSKQLVTTSYKTQKHHVWLTVAQWWQLASSILVDIGSDNGLLPAYTKLWPEPMLIYHQHDQQNHCGLVTPYGNIVSTWSTLAQVMACCLMAASHYLNQCWLIFVESSVTFIRGQFHKRHLSHKSLKISLKNTSLKFRFESPRG